MPDSPTPPAEPDTAQTPPTPTGAGVRVRAPEADADTAAASAPGSPGARSGLRPPPLRSQLSPFGRPSPVVPVAGPATGVVRGRGAEALA